MRATPFTCSGTRFIRSSASSVQRDDLLGLDVERRVELARRQQDVARAPGGGGSPCSTRGPPRARRSARRSGPGSGARAAPCRRSSRTFSKHLPSSSVIARSTPSSAASLPADLEVRLVDLGQPGVDDLLVELLLLLEAEDLRGLLGEHADDPVEHGVVEVGIVDGDRVDRPVRAPWPSAMPSLSAVERLGAAVEADDDRALLRLAAGSRLRDHQRVDGHLADERARSTEPSWLSRTRRSRGRPSRRGRSPSRWTSSIRAL